MLMQYKHNISLFISRRFDLTKFDKCRYQRKVITSLANHGSYFSPKIRKFDNNLNDEETYGTLNIQNVDEVEGQEVSQDVF